MNILERIKNKKESLFLSIVTLRMSFPTMKVGKSEEIGLYRAVMYSPNALDYVVNPMKSLKFLYWKNRYSLILPDGEQSDVYDWTSTKLIAAYASLKFGRELNKLVTAKLIWLMLEGKFKEQQIKKILSDANLYVNKKGNIEVRLIRPVQKITALIVFVFFLLVAIFCVYSLAVFLLSDRCTPTCAITGATELLLISSIFIWSGKKIGFRNKKIWCLCDSLN